MITTKGKELLARYISGISGTWAGAIELGVGETAATVGDTSLEFPFVRVRVDYIDYDPLNHNIIVRGTLGDEVAGTFYEIGVFSAEDFPDQSVGHQLILDYSGADTVYSSSNATIQSGGARVGTNGTRLSVPTGQTGFVRGFRPGLNLSTYSGNDVINLAYQYTSTGGTPSVTIRFETTTADYFTHTFTPTAGYNIKTVARASFTSTGAPVWSDVSGVYVYVSDKADLLLDGIMIEDTINVQEYGMVARGVLAEPIIKSQFSESEVTYVLDLDF